MMSPRTARPGFSLVELLISLLILAIVLGSVLGLANSAIRAQTRNQQAVRADEALRAAESLIVNIMRSAGADPMKTGNPEWLPDPLAHGTFDNVQVLADYNPPNSSTGDPLEDVLIYLSGDTMMVRWQTGGTAQPAAFPIDSLQFDYFSGNGSALTTAAEADSATLVRVTLAATTSIGTRRVQTWIFLRN